MKHSIRILALLLAVLLVVLPPLQARAAIGTGTGILIGLAATAVIGSVIAGLGVMPGSDRSVFDGLVDDCIASPEVSPFLDGNNLIQVLRYTNGIGNVRYGVLRNLIDAVFGWLWSSRTLSPSTLKTFSAGTPIYITDEVFYMFEHDILLSVIRDYANGVDSVVYYFVHPNKTRLIGSFTTGGTTTSISRSAWYYRAMGGYLDESYDNDRAEALISRFGLAFDNISFGYSEKELAEMILSGEISSALSSSYDVSLGTVAEPDSDISESYANWSAGSIALPWPGADSGITIPGIDVPGTDEGTDEGTGEDTGEEEGEEEGEKKLVYWPTGTAGSLADIGSDATTGALTQEGVISGVGTLDDILTGALPGTIVGGLTGDVAIDTTVPGEGAGTDEGIGEGTGEGEIVYPTDIPSYSLDLTDIFPFCIPFDIYEFLSILAADPEAPVFHWKVPVPQLGTEYEVEVDLSPWNDVAKLFRTLELLAFIVGLAMMTRDKFIRS